ncbi:MAG: ureidoglycolate lyase [Hyphomicrobiaceae bacterium]
MRTILAAPITPAAFAPYGDVLECPAAPGRVYFDEGLANGRPDVGASLSFAHVTPIAEMPLRVRQMERHEFSSQSFVPLDVARYIVVVAPKAASGGPDAARACAFLVPGDVGITYHIDVWHHPMAVLDRPARFAVMMFRDAGPRDEEFVPVPEPFLVTVG